MNGNGMNGTATAEQPQGQPKPTLNSQQARELLGPPLTKKYISLASQYQQTPRQLPLLGFDMIRAMLLDPAVRLGLAMRQAPIQGAEIAYKDGTDATGKPKWVPGVLAKNPGVGQYVYRQLQRIWTHGLDEVLKAQIWGWSAGETMYRVTSRGTVEVKELLGRHAVDTRALLRDGVKCGTRVTRVAGSGGDVDLMFPKGWFHSYKPEAGAHYGQSALMGAYSPWADKAFQGGATDIRRLFMHADAYGGKDMTYPDGVTTVGGQEVSNRDLALQVVEQLQAGGVTVRPTQVRDGVEQWTLTRASVPANPSHILQYPKDLDTEIYHGLEIPDDVIESETGAWAGKRIPMAAFFSGLDVWLVGLLGDLVTQILEPLVLLNFGRAEEFAVTHKPLAEQAMEQQGQAGQGQGQTPGQGQPQQQGGMFGPPESGPRPAPVANQQLQQPPQQFQRPQLQLQTRMSLDPELAVGEGVLSAAELVKAARKVIRMSAVHAPVGGITIAGKDFTGGEFIPGESLKKATAEQRRQIETGKSAKNKTGPSEKVQRAQSNAKRIGRDVQRYCEEYNEPKFAKAINGASFADNEPIDVVVADANGRVAHGIELKTMVDNSNNKITMKGEAIRRKLSWARRNKASIHTIVIDDSEVFNAKGAGKHDESKRRYYYRRGVGSFRVGGMYQAKDINEIRELLNTPTKKLPEGAR